MHAERVAFLEQRITYNSRLLVLTRQSKHNLLDYTQELTAHVYKLREQMQAEGIQVPDFRLKFYEDLCGAEDRALAQLTLPAEIQPAQGS